MGCREHRPTVESGYNVEGPGIIVKYACSAVWDWANKQYERIHYRTSAEKVHGLEVHRLRHFKQITAIHAD